MNKQQRMLVIAMSAMLALVLVLILVISLNQRGTDQPVIQPDTLVVSTDAPGPTSEPVSEDELGRQAMSEEGDEHEPGGEGEEALPVD